MKRFICLFLMLSLLLAGCGNKSAEVAPTEPPTQPPTTEVTVPETEPPTEPPTTEATEPETEPPTEPPIPSNPLTGEPLEAEYTGRPVAFSLNNISACLPQYGLDDLDWMFEVETEGGITRCVGIMTDPASADTIGPIRSCRTYFLNLSVSYNAPLFHCGGSGYSDNNQYSISGILDGWDHVNQKTNGGAYFYRDSSRNGSYAFEHTLFTSGDRMVKAMEDYGYSNTSGAPVSYGYQFSDTIELGGQPANDVDITFRGGKYTNMEYDAESGLYKAHQYGRDWVDGSTGENATFRNVLALHVPQIYYYGLSFYEMEGSGDGYYAAGGQMIPIKWYHDGVGSPFRFTLADGVTPVTLGVGTTYCAIIAVEGSVSAE